MGVGGGDGAARSASASSSDYRHSNTPRFVRITIISVRIVKVMIDVEVYRISRKNLL